MRKKKLTDREKLIKTVDVLINVLESLEEQIIEREKDGFTKLYHTRKILDEGKMHAMHLINDFVNG